MQHPKISRFRQGLLTWFCLVGAGVGLPMAGYGFIKGQTYAFFALQAAFGLLAIGVLGRYDRLRLSPYLLILFITGMVFYRSYSIRSTLNLTIVALPIIISGIMTPRWFITLLFGVTVAFMGWCAYQGIFHLTQVRDPDTGIYLANTLSTVVPVIFSMYAIAMLISKFLVDAIDEVDQANRQLLETRESLAQSEQNLVSILRNTLDIIYRLDPEGKVIFVNDAVRRYGYELSEVIGSHFLDFVHPEDRDAAKKWMVERVRGGVDHDLEVRFLLPRYRPETETEQAGSRFPYFLVNAEGVFESSNGTEMYIGVQGSARDITERKRLQEELGASEEYNRVLFDESKIPLVVIDPETRLFIDCNPAAVSAYGAASREEVIGKGPEDFSPERQYDGTDTKTAVAKSLSPPYEYGTRHSLWLHRRPDGTEWDAEVYLMTFSLRGRKLMQTAIIDVTDKKKAEAAIKESEERLRAFIEQTEEAVAIIDEEGRIMEWNPAAETLSGWPRSEVLGRFYWDAIYDQVPRPRRTEERRKQLEARIREALRTGVPAFSGPAEFETERQDGTTRITRQTVFPIRTAKGYRFGTIALDVTETRQAEEKRKLLESQLRQAQRLEALGQLAGGVAHDLNNMLTPILGYSELLASDLDPDHPSLDYVHQIVSAAERSRDLIRQLLVFARRQAVETRPMSLGQAAKNLEKMLRRTIRENIIIEFLPGARGGVIMGDIGQIEQVVMNLAVNAQDAMPEGGTIIIETMEADLDEEYCRNHPDVNPGPYVLLSISDTGEGMEPSIIPKIFDPFFSTKEVGKGTGLGLATVYGIVKQHGGHINVFSEPGKGTTFHLYFPRSGELSSVVAAESRQAFPAGSETILVVEDQPQVRGLVCSILKNCGYHVLSAANAEAALEMVSAYPSEIPLVVTDVVMTGMNGAELYRKLIERKPGIRALFMSGYDRDVLVTDLPSHSKGYFIQKPFNVGTLAAKVREALQGPDVRS